MFVTVPFRKALCHACGGDGEIGLNLPAETDGWAGPVTPREPQPSGEAGRAVALRSPRAAEPWCPAHTAHLHLGRRASALCGQGPRPVERSLSGIFLISRESEESWAAKRWLDSSAPKWHDRPKQVPWAGPPSVGWKTLTSSEEGQSLWKNNPVLHNSFPRSCQQGRASCSSWFLVCRRFYGFVRGTQK